jgi:hypothetical protein
MSSSAADAAAALDIDPEYLKFRQSISSLAKLSGVTVFSNIKLDDVDGLKSSDSYELWSQKILVIFEAIGYYEMIIKRIDLSPLGFAEDLSTFQLAHQQVPQAIIQVVSNIIFDKISRLQTLHDICRSTSAHPTDVNLPFSWSFHFIHLCASNNKSVC